MKKITVFILAASVLMVVVGTNRGEMATVLNKGINLCLECVGLG